MELTKYDIFVQIIENGNLTKTAQQIGYTQSAISHIVSGLEAELGLSLLVRSHSGVKLTPEGERILPYIYSISCAYHNLYSCANEIRGLNSGVIRINTPQSMLLSILPEVVEKFQRKYPGVKLEFLPYQSKFEDVLANRSDLAFVCINDYFSQPNLHQCEVIPFMEEEMTVIMSEDHPVAKRPFFPVELLEKEKFVLIQDGNPESGHIFKKYGVTPQVLFYAPDAVSIMAMVEKGVGISLIPWMHYQSLGYKICAKPLPDRPRRKLCILYKKQPLLSVAARTFLCELLETYHISDEIATCFLEK